MEFNERQLKAIDTRNSDILVSASAGSGKTTVMIERVLRLIEGGADLRRMLIVTFTKAAAADMRAKLFKALQKSDSDQARRALKALPAADISTLHSFCGKLARTYFYAIDADPAFELLGEGDGVLFERCLEEATAWAADGGAAGLYEIMLSHRKDKPFKEAVRRLYEAAVGMPEPDEFLAHALDNCLNDGEAKAALKTEREAEKKKFLEFIDDFAVRNAAAGFERNLNAIAEVRAAVAADDILLIGKSPSTKVPPLFADLNEEFKTLKDKAKEYLAKGDESGNLAPSESAFETANSLVETVKKLFEIYTREKAKNGVADYNDLEHYAYSILRSDCGDAVRASYDYVFVDEYQDINPLQDRIIGLVKSENNLFMVGDLKQSIYAFRGCDPSIFAEKSVRFASGGGTAVELNANFRTCPEIIENVNRVFRKCMKRDFGGVDYAREAALVPSREDKGVFRYVNVVTEDEREERQPVYSLRTHVGEMVGEAEAESDFVVTEVLKLLEEGAEPQDIAVLTRSRGELSRMIYEKLKHTGVPTFVSAGGDPSLAPETAPLVSFMRLLRNPLDDIALTAVLTSFIGRMTSAELAEIARIKGRDEPFCVAARRSEKAAKVFEMLEKYSSLSQSVSAARLLTKAALETGAFVEADRVGDDRHAALSAFIASCEGSVAQALERIDGGGRGEKGLPDGCLKIMPVHMSKGLEFEHVFLAGVNHGFNLSDLKSHYYIDRKWGLAMQYPDPTTHEWKATFLTRAVRGELKKRMLEEEMRVMYVALTRAKRTLTVSGCNIRDMGELKRVFTLPARPADFMYALTPENREGVADRVSPSEETETLVVKGEPGERADELRKRMDFDCLGEDKKAKTSVSAAIGSEDDGYYAGESSGLDTEEAAARGTAFHLFMQKLDFGRDFSLQCTAFAADHPGESALVDYAKAKRAKELILPLVEGRKLYREKEFVFDDGGTLVQGVIDLLAVGGGGAVIIDYKTGAHVRKKSYAEQLRYYGKAVEKILDLKVEAMYICGLDTGEIVEISEI